MITIEFASGDVQGICNYRVEIDRKLICMFAHDNTQGPAECLQKAADAVALQEWAELEIINEPKGG